MHGLEQVASADHLMLGVEHGGSYDFPEISATEPISLVGQSVGVGRVPQPRQIEIEDGGPGSMAGKVEVNAYSTWIRSSRLFASLPIVLTSEATIGALTAAPIRTGRR